MLVVVFFVKKKKVPTQRVLYGAMYTLYVVYYTYLQQKVFWAYHEIYIHLYILYIIYPKAEHLEREINEGTYIHIMYIQNNSSNND